jgi:hypothetical protein
MGCAAVRSAQRFNTRFKRVSEANAGEVEVGGGHFGSYALAFEANDQHPADVGRLKNAA